MFSHQPAPGQSSESTQPQNVLDEIPDHLTCPVTLEIFKEPVTVFPSGFVYEETVITQLMANAAKEGVSALCPLTRTPIQNYVTVWSIKAAVSDYLAAHAREKNQRQEYKDSTPDEQHENKSPSTPVTTTTTTINTTASKHSNSHASQTSDVTQQIHEDETFARTLQYQEELKLAQQVKALQAAQQHTAEVQREQQAHLAYRAIQEQRLVQLKAQQVQHRKPALNSKEKENQQTLINDVQNLIYALHFEEGPTPTGRVDNLALFAVAVIERLLLKPLPWQEIIVKEGPKTPDMYEVLKAAILALKEINPTILAETKKKHAGQYDLVATWLKGTLSLSKDGYANFAKAMGTIQDQPGYLVDQILVRVEYLLRTLTNKYHIDYSQTRTLEDRPRMGK